MGDSDKLYEPLNWQGNFRFPRMVRLRTIADGSCFFHAIANAFFVPYRTGELRGKPVSRSDIIRGMRHDLSIKLGAKPDAKSLAPYDLLSRGQLKDLAKTLPQFSLAKMQAQLDSSDHVDNAYNEFISNELNKDIYLLDLSKQDVYMTGNDDEILYRGRESIVILYMPNHYELVGLLRENDPRTVDTLFQPGHEFIQALRRRMGELRAPRR